MSPPDGDAAGRAERLAAALRENLKRRKAQAKNRDAADGPVSGASPAPMDDRTSTPSVVAQPTTKEEAPVAPQPPARAEKDRAVSEGAACVAARRDTR